MVLHDKSSQSSFLPIASPTPRPTAKAMRMQHCSRERLSVSAIPHGGRRQAQRQQEQCATCRSDLKRPTALIQGRSGNSADRKRPRNCLPSRLGETDTVKTTAGLETRESITSELRGECLRRCRRIASSGSSRGNNGSGRMAAVVVAIAACCPNITEGFLIPAAGAGRDWSDSARFLGRSVRAEAGLQRQLQDRLSWDEEPPISAARQELLHAKAGGGGGETGRNRRRSAVRRASGSLGQPTRTDRGFDPSSLAMTAYLPPWSSSLSSLPPSSSSRAASTSLVVSGNASVAGTLQGDGGSRGTCGAVSQPATRRGARWRLEAHKLESTRHGGGEEHGASAEAGRAGESGDSGGGTGADSGASPARNSPLRWMRRTLRAGWGRRGGVTGSSTRGRWGFRNGGDRSRGRFSAGGAGQDDGRVSTMEESSLHAKDDEGNGDGSQGWGLAGWASDGERRWSGKDDSLGELRHPLVTRQTWSSSDDDETRRGGGVDGDDTHGDKAWVSRPPWMDKHGLQELFRAKGGDLHLRTLAKIQTLMGREDQAEETLLKLIRDPYNLGDASWRPESAADTAEWQRLEAHQKRIKNKHLKDVILDAERSLALSAEYEGTILDYSRMNVSQLTMRLLYDLARRQGLKEKINAMFSGEKINNTENRAVLHVALRSQRDDAPVMVDGVDVVSQVHETLDQVRDFSDQIRSGKLRGATGKLLTNIVAVGIGGSYLGPEFVHEAFKTQEYAGREQAELYKLRFLSNVDPVDVRRTLYDLDPEETLVVVISKTFTTAETMLNARTARQWLWDTMGKDSKVAEKHMAACASESATERVTAFGIPKDRLFPLWDWVGGRYSVCSSVGALPLSLKYGFRQFENFLAGARSMDQHFLHAPFEKNMPVLMGLLGVWNISFMGYKTRTILPYAEALLKFPAHIQQLAMESNGKRVTRGGKKVSYDIGQVDFGEPGTNGQHSFFQLLHMGQICPAEFIGFIESQHPLHVEGEPICSHDELMANFFAQPDALAVGKPSSELAREGCRPDLVPHRTFDGNRPSLSLLVPKVNAYHLGQMLALYEHRTAVEGFMWDINSFDQWGVELGKSLATNIRDKMKKFRTEGQEAPSGLNPSTSHLMSRYLQQSETLVKKVGNINHRSKSQKED